MLNKEKKRQSIVGQGEDTVNGGDHGRFKEAYNSQRRRRQRRRKGKVEGW